MTGRLQNAGLTPAYRRNLRDAALWLLSLCARLGLRITPRSSVRDIDHALARAIETAYEEGEKLYWVSLGVLGLQRRLKVSGPFLRATWASIRGWRTLMPSRSRAPITHVALEALLLMCLSRGQHAHGWDRHLWWACMLASWLAFCGLMRPNEVVSLRKKDLAFPDAIALGEESLGLVVIVKQPKTKRTYRTQMVLVKEARVVKWMYWWVRDLSANQLVFPMTGRVWGSRMRTALFDLSLESCGYTPASFRAGGATHHYRVFQNIPQLQFQGRWKSSESLKHYIHEAMSVHIAQQASDEGRSKLECSRSFVHFLSRPPARSAQSLLRVE